MLYRQKKDTYIRNYSGYGYITSTGIFNDRLVNESGAVFLLALSRQPQTLEELADKIIKSFVDVDIETIKQDAKEFYETLIQDGFIIKGETEEELNAQDVGFTYNSIMPKTIQEDFTPKIQRATEDTQSKLEMLKKYPNIICDTAFATKENLEKIRQADFANRIVFGSDFPIGALEIIQ